MSTRTRSSLRHFVVVMVAVAAGGLVPATGAGAASNAGTGLSASVTTAGDLSSTFQWAIAKSGTPGSQTVTVGNSGSVQWSITLTKSGSGTVGGYLDGQICVTNTGTIATQGLAITDQLTKPPAMTALSTVTVDVSAKPVLAAGGSYCYPYKIAVPASAITPGATYKTTALVTITNQSGSLGTPEGPSPSATSPLPSTPVPVNPSVTVNDTNGQSLTFTASGTQTYNQIYPCPTAGGVQTLTESNTATIAQTGQAATGTATIKCTGTPTTTTTALANTLIAPGGTDSDQATINGAPANAGGTITYKIYTDNHCGTLYTDATPASNTVTNGQAPASNTVPFPTAGDYWWVATYTGDPSTGTLGSNSGCANEHMLVNSFTDGQYTTYTQGDWSTGQPAGLITNHFNSIYGTFVIGDPAGFYAQFGSSQDLVAFFPQLGTASAFNSILFNPTTTHAGVFGGEVAALKLNVDFADAGLLARKFGDLTMCDMTSGFAVPVPDLNGVNVRQFLALVNTAIAAEPVTDTPAALDAVAAALNVSFENGAISTFAQQHLANGTCP